MRNKKLEETSVQRPKWEASFAAFLGFMVGGLGGMAYEMSEIFLTDFNEPGTAGMESFADIFLDMVGAAIGGAILFAVAALIRNRILARE